MKSIPLRFKYRGSLQALITNAIILLSLFIVFCSLNKSSWGSVCGVLSVILIVLNFNNRNLAEWVPFFIVSLFTIILLFMSGQAAERGFNAPINHSLKFIDLLFSVSLSIGMQSLTFTQKKKVLKVTMLSVLISTFVSLYNVIFVDKYAIRFFQTRGFMSVFDFSQFYAICILASVLVLGIISYRKKVNVWKHVIFVMPILVCIGISLYVTGVILTVFGIVLAFAVYKYKENKSKAVLWAFALALLIIVIFAFGNSISDWIYKITEPLNWILRDRLRSVADTIFRTDHNILYSYERRDELAGYSLNTFRQHPFFGIGYSSYGYGVIGCHQEWQDMLGVFGIIGTASLAVLIAYISKIIVKSISNKTDIYAFYLALLLFVVLGFLNPCISLPVLCVVFVIAPNISAMFEPDNTLSEVKVSYSL